MMSLRRGAILLLGLALPCIAFAGAWRLALREEPALGLIHETFVENEGDSRSRVLVHLLSCDLRKIRVRVVGAEGLRTPSSLAASVTALAAVNGGFFSLQSGEPVDFEMSDEVVGHRAHPRNPRTLIAFFPGAALIARFPRPRPPGAAPLGVPPKVWTRVRDALAAGPRLIRRGKSVVQEESEGFGADFALANPRTAAGLTRGGFLLLAVADGRQPGYSVGLTLQDLALFLLGRGAWEALNLDGGGSCAMILGGRVVNRPSDKEPLSGMARERSVANILAILPH